MRETFEMLNTSSPVFFPSFPFIFTMCKEAQFALNTRLPSPLVVPTKAVRALNTRWSATNSTTLTLVRRRRFWLITNSALICITVLESGHSGLIHGIFPEVQITRTGADAADTAGIRIIIHC